MYNPSSHLETHSPPINHTAHVDTQAAQEVTAREGLPVKGTNAKPWEGLRPKIVHESRPAKVRGNAST